MLPAGAHNEAAYLESMLSNFSASYKLYWFKGIFQEIISGQKHISFKRIIARMIASAWYPVIFFNLSLGFADKLADAIWFIHNTYDIPREAKENDIIHFICRCDDRELSKKVDSFMQMVPYRLIRPFYDKEIEAAKRTRPGFSDHNINPLILELNQRSDDIALYKMDYAAKELQVREGWISYIQKNAVVIEGWLNYKLVEYLQLRNPSVPAIPFKIFAPLARSLNAAKELWLKIGQEYSYPDIYTGLVFSEDRIAAFGRLSIDHFIPWSFVLHDELWNLCPTFQTVNSQKSNRLPDLEYYLNEFCNLQYKAFITARSIGIKEKALASYHTLHNDIFAVVADQDRGRELFYKAIGDAVRPLYQIALNQGYNTWIYRSEQ